MKHEDVCTLLKNDEDKDILTRKGFHVNMRLYSTSPVYRTIIRDSANYIWELAKTKREGYKQPHGFSGANAGIPFNIIATPEMVMLNPHLLTGNGTRYSYSNCGSLLLDAPIKVRRFACVTVEFFDLEGVRHELTGYYPTLQHEIDHNLGILILQRQIK